MLWDICTTPSRLNLPLRLCNVFLLRPTLWSHAISSLSKSGLSWWVYSLYKNLLFHYSQSRLWKCAFAWLWSGLTLQFSQLRVFDMLLNSYSNGASPIPTGEILRPLPTMWSCHANAWLVNWVHIISYPEFHALNIPNIWSCKFSPSMVIVTLKLHSTLLTHQGFTP